MDLQGSEDGEELWRLSRSAVRRVGDMVSTGNLGILRETGYHWNMEPGYGCSEDPHPHVPLT